MNHDYGHFIDISENIDLPNKIINPTNIPLININSKSKPKSTRICIQLFNYNTIVYSNHIICVFMVGALFYGTIIFFPK